MKAVLCIVLGLLLPSWNMATTGEQQVILGNNQFTSNLYKVLSKKEGNVFFSPISVHAVLSMAYQGAQGTTAHKFGQVLKVAEAKSASEGYKNVIARLNSVENVTLHLANKIFVQQGLELLPEFGNSLTKNFLSEVQHLNFANSEEAAAAINTWVEEKTNNKITQLIDPSALDDLTRLVLVNAIYFKGDWRYKFNAADTKTEPFYLNDNDQIDVQMMHIKQKFSYKEDNELEAQVLELPYVNDDLSMIIVLPNQKNGIGDLEQKLENYDLAKLTAEMYYTEVNVALPKFKIEETIELKDALTTIGLGDIFDSSKANFNGMIQLNPNENLYVSKVIQKAFIEVNEEGAEAAAATGVVVRVTRSIISSMEFRADRPFIYFFYSKHNNGSILFMGKLALISRNIIRDEL